jgi:hypothetical protein
LAYERRLNKISKQVKPNDYILHDDYAEIVIYSPKFGTFYAQIDLEDVELCKQYKWHVNKIYWSTKDLYYVGACVNKQTLSLHSLLCPNPIPEGYVADHIDGDNFNNRKSNLQCCTHSQNASKQKKRITNTSGATGVTWDKVTNKWMAYIKKNYHQKTLGYFNTVEEAAKCRKEAEKIYFKGYEPIE